jgi:N-acetyl-alpha-D-muramate 1-phosphate uridylyltransferase
MKAMILAAGEGRRMLPLTLTTPKPLLLVHGKPLIEHHLLRLLQAGVTEVIINLAYLGEQISAALGNGGRFGLNIQYSREPAPLETAGALLHAAHLLGDKPFLLVNGDVWTDYPFARLITRTLRGWAHKDLGHLVMVNNPSFKPAGDFSLTANGALAPLADSGFTFAGLSLLHPDLLRRYPQPTERLPLAPVFSWAISQQALTGEYYGGVWADVGTPERLHELNRQ